MCNHDFLPPSKAQLSYIKPFPGALRLVLIFLWLAAAAMIIISSPTAASAQTVHEIKLYPANIRLDLGKTRTVAAAAFDQFGNYIPNQTFSFSSSSGSASIRRSPEGNTEGNTSRYSANLGETAAVTAGTAEVTASLNGVVSNRVTVRVVDPAAAPLLRIGGDADLLGGQAITVRTGEPVQVSADQSQGVGLIEWFWGDGDRTGDLLSATHAYLAAGVYPLRVKITNSAGASAERTITVTVIDQPAATRTFTVRTAAELMNAYNQCMGGEEIVIPAGTVIRGRVSLPARDFSDYVTIRSSGQMPDGRTRVGPADESQMATFRGNYTSDTPFVIQNRASRIRLSGLKFDPFHGGSDWDPVYYLLQIGEVFGQRVPEDNPHHIILDHCMINPPDHVPVVHGILNDGYKVSMLNSSFGNIKTYGSQDSQAVFSLDGRGAHVYSNTRFEAASENIIYGGADIKIEGMVPQDIEFRRCLFTKPLKWMGLKNSQNEAINTKNLMETKNVRRMYVESSIFENHWDSHNSQYMAITIKTGSAPPGDGQGALWVEAEDMVFENNRMSHINGGISVVRDFYHDGMRFDTLKPNHIAFRNLLVDDMTYGRFGSYRTWGFYLAGVDDFTAEQVTMIDADETTDAIGERLMLINHIANFRLKMTDSIFPLGYYGIGNSCAEGSKALHVGASGLFDAQGSSCSTNSSGRWTFAGNVVAKNTKRQYNSTYPPGNSYPQNMTQIGFNRYRRCAASPVDDPCDSTESDFALRADSMFKGTASNGRDPGVDTVVLTERLKCTRNGQAAGCLVGGGGGEAVRGAFPGLDVPVVPAALEAENFDTGGESVAYRDLFGGTESLLYRGRPDRVDLVANANASGGFAVFEASAGEWLEYTIKAARTRSGSYDINIRYASMFAGGRIRLYVDGHPAGSAEAVELPSTGGWSTFSTVTIRSVAIPAGTHTLRLAIEANSPEGCGCVAGNFDRIDVAATKYRAPRTNPVLASNHADGRDEQLFTSDVSDSVSSTSGDEQ